MKNLLTAVLVSTFALGSVAAFAADTYKTEELTQAQRQDLRDRASKLQEQAAQTPRPERAEQKAGAVKQTPVGHTTKKSTKHPVKKAPHKA